MQLDFSKIFSNIFKTKKPVQNLQSAFLLNGVPYYTNTSGEIYDISLARSCIHTIANHCAKLQAKVVENNKFVESSPLQLLLSTRPNPYMSAFDFIYKTVSMLYSANNAFVYCQKDDSGKIIGLYPIPYRNFELLEAKGMFFARFSCLNGDFVIPYEEIVHLRRHFNNEDLMGTQQSRVLEPTQRLNESVVESIVNGVRSSNKLQGILKASSLVQEDELKAKKDEFVKNYMSIENAGGIAVLDNKFEFQQVKLEPVIIDEKQMEAVSNDLFRYYNISEKIVQSNYSELEYEAFFDSVVEPFAIQFSLELTNKIFTQKEILNGLKIILSAERMGFASMDTRVKAIQTLMPLGILSINESRKIIELDEIENGERHLVSLNFVDLKEANKYQVGSDEGEKDE